MPTFLDESTTRPVPPTVRSEEKRLVELAVVEKKFVVVAFVEVELRKVRFWNVEEAVASRLPKVPRPEEVKFPPLPIVKKRLVDDAVVEKKLVVVALVPVALMKVKFWRVLEPTTKRSPAVLMVEVAEPPILN